MEVGGGLAWVGFPRVDAGMRSAQARKLTALAEMPVSSSGLELPGTAGEAACVYVRNYVAFDTGEVSDGAQKYIKG